MIPRLSARAALAAATLVAGLLAAAPARAAFPVAGESYSVHDHATKGANWHVEVEISPKTRLEARTVVVYVQQCGATVIAQPAKIDLKGRLNILDRPFEPKQGGQGTWTVKAQFTSEHELVGESRVVTPRCATGTRTFAAHAGGHEHSDGHKSHTDHHSGTRPGEFPALASATPRQRKQARRLWLGTLRVAQDVFGDYQSALLQRYRRYPLRWPRPLLFHLRRRSYERDKAILDPRRPESLVYWWPKKGDPILLGFMYRAPLGRPPVFAGNLLAWHSHTEKGSRGDNQMTHVWLTRDLRSALANCLPVAQLQQAIPGFRYSRPAHGAGHESRRCRG